MDPKDFVNLTDEEIANMTEAPVFNTPAATETTTTTTTAEGDQGTVETVDGGEDTVTTEVAEGEEGKSTSDADGEEDSNKNKQPDQVVENDGIVQTDDGEQLGEDGKPLTPDPAKQATQEGVGKSEKVETPDYKAFYETALAPIKANGKSYEMKSPDDLRALAQQGLNYTQKMQQIAPIRKIGMMLQNHGLLDESRLSYLIDLHNKKPEAIQKLIKDAGIDPLEIDVSTEPKYTPSNYSVGEDEASFRTTLEDMKSSQEGQETLNLIHTTWDEGSKQALWSNPGIMPIIAEQKANGVYDRVSAEVDRRRALGQIPPNVTFINAYQAIGQEMGQAGQLNDLVKPAAAAVAAPVIKQPIDTRTVAKKPDTNAAKVAAASPTKAAGRATSSVKNPLEMSDAEFEQELLKQRGYL